MLAVYLIRHAELPGSEETKAAHGLETALRILAIRNEEVGRLGGGVAVAMKNWFLETWLYIVLFSVVYGAVVGYGACKTIKFALRR